MPKKTPQPKPSLPEVPSDRQAGGDEGARPGEAPGVVLVPLDGAVLPDEPLELTTIRIDDEDADSTAAVASSAGDEGWFARRPALSVAISLVYHLGLLVILAVLMISGRTGHQGHSLTSQFRDPSEMTAGEMIEAPEVRAPSSTTTDFGPVDPRDPQIAVADILRPTPARTNQRGNPREGPGGLAEFFGSGGGLAGRDLASRGSAPGVTGASEEAVERGLRWLIAHQRRDGSWSLNLDLPPCEGRCTHGSIVGRPVAATALALACFFGAGYTHVDGTYQSEIRQGLYYLISQARMTSQGADLRGGSIGDMYEQGIATLVLCEAYAMTEDPALRDLAQQAIRFIENAQHESGGGWRYSPGMAGDMSVTGWQVMALKSGILAGLAVDRARLYRVDAFLRELYIAEGNRAGWYGYVGPSRGTEATTAVGVLCRLYLGYEPDAPSVEPGIAHFGRWGPSAENIYYNYYAALVLHHAGGPVWDAWHPKMRDYLVATQAKRGHENGSWFFRDPYGTTRGGRVFSTTLAIMTLEVYYRYLPLYRSSARSP